jgi:gliding motility-associated lipoprotein GldD
MRKPLFCLLLLVAGCGNTYTPKPRGFFRIDFPKKAYQHYSSDCPFEFDYPVYAEVVKDQGRNVRPCWINIEFPKFKGTVHLSYLKIENNLAKYEEDSRNLTYKHTQKAESIEEITIHPSERVYGIYYDIKGNTASSVQFTLTDSSRHFLRGALYFYTIPSSDSLAPVIDFIRKDVDYMIKTMRWKDN